MTDTERIDALESWLKLNGQEQMVQIWITRTHPVEIIAATTPAQDVVNPGECWTRNTLREAVDAAMGA